MGGWGSGRYPYGSVRLESKRVTAAFLALDVVAMHRAGVLVAGTVWRLIWGRRAAPRGRLEGETCADSVLLRYCRQAEGEAAENVVQTVGLARTPCRYGGFRVWFVCPACCRRVRLLYGAGRRFLCRRCHQLTYRSQRERAFERAQAQFAQVEAQIGASEGVIPLLPPRPKGMHRRRYERLAARWEALRERQLRLLGIDWIGKRALEGIRVIAPGDPDWREEAGVRAQEKCGIIGESVRGTVGEEANGIAGRD